MMDLREKFKLFIDKNKTINQSVTVVPKSISEGSIVRFSGDELESAFLLSRCRLERQVSVYDNNTLTAEAEQAVIDSIDRIFFDLDGRADDSDLILKSLPTTTDRHTVAALRSRLRKQQAVLCRRLSSLIASKQSLCTEEMERVGALQEIIRSLVGCCRTGRMQLMIGRGQFTSASLGILARYSRRQRVAAVLYSLKMIRTLQMTDVRLQSLLRDSDYRGAIHLLLECRSVLSSFTHFVCISQLDAKLQDTLELAEEQLDAALAKTIVHFDPNIYSRLYGAYTLLRKTHTLMDQLHLHIASHIHNAAFTIVFAYVEHPNEGETVPSRFAKCQYSELCKYVTLEGFLPCLTHLCKCMWSVLKSYRNIVRWHEEFHEPQTKKKEMEEDDDTPSEIKFIHQKLEHGRLRLWQDATAKVRTFLLASDLSWFKFDDFLHVLAVLHCFVHVGREFCGSDSEGLQESAKQQSVNYFHKYHRHRLEELHMFLENEGWEVCPVQSSFSVYQLTEFQFLRPLIRSSANDSPRKINAAVTTDERNTEESLFDRYHGDASPFEEAVNESMEENFLLHRTLAHSHSDDSDNDELREESVQEVTKNFSTKKTDSESTQSKNPIVTNTTLVILRLMGRYVEMMTLLQPIAFDVMNCLIQLFEYYFFTVCSIFGSGEMDVPPPLQFVLNDIQDRIILDVADEKESSEEWAKVPCPTLSPHADLNSPSSLFGLKVRVAAMESLAFMTLQLESLRRHLELLLPQQRCLTVLKQFYSSEIHIVTEARTVVYHAVAVQLTDHKNILSHMATVKWDISDLRSQHNEYVDWILKHLQNLKRHIDIYISTSLFPPVAHDCLWHCIVSTIHRTMLEGYSRVSRCSNEGRSLMQLDFQHFEMKLELLIPVRPIPDRVLVETYIKAYYVPDTDLEEWVQEHLNLYSPRQVGNLVNVMGHVGKRVRQKIVARMEELTRGART